MKLEIRCKKCGRLHLTLDEFYGRMKYDFKCRRCKNTNIGVITMKIPENKGD